MKRIGRGLLKPEAAIEGARFFVSGVNYERSHAGLVSDSRAAKHRVLQQRASETAVLVRLIDRQTRQDDDRNRSVHGLPLQHALCRVRGLDLPHNERVVADDLLPLVRRHKDACGASSFGMTRMP